MGRLERFVYKRASAIAVISNGIKQNLIGKGVPPEKVHVISPWADESVYRPVPPDSQLAKQLGMAGRFNVVSAVLLGSVLSGPVDAIFAEHPPLTTGLAAWILGRVRRARFLFAVNDLWPESVKATGMVRNQGFLRFIGRLERFVYKRAAAIAVISNGIKQNLVGKGVPPEKVHVIPHWADESVYRPVPPDPELARQLGMAGRFNVVFAGQLGLAQGLDVVLDAADGPLERQLAEVEESGGDPGAPSGAAT